MTTANTNTNANVTIVNATVNNKENTNMTNATKWILRDEVCRLEVGSPIIEEYIESPENFDAVLLVATSEVLVEKSEFMVENSTNENALLTALYEENGEVVTSDIMTGLYCKETQQIVFSKGDATLILGYYKKNDIYIEVDADYTKEEQVIEHTSEFGFKYVERTNHGTYTMPKSEVMAFFEEMNLYSYSVNYAIEGITVTHNKSIANEIIGSVWSKLTGKFVTINYLEYSTQGRGKNRHIFVINDITKTDYMEYYKRISSETEFAAWLKENMSDEEYNQYMKENAAKIAANKKAEIERVKAQTAKLMAEMQAKLDSMTGELEELSPYLTEESNEETA